MTTKFPIEHQALFVMILVTDPGTNEVHVVLQKTVENPLLWELPSTKADITYRSAKNPRIAIAAKALGLDEPHSTFLGCERNNLPWSALGCYKVVADVSNLANFPPDCQMVTVTDFLRKLRDYPETFGEATRFILADWSKRRAPINTIETIIGPFYTCEAQFNGTQADLRVMLRQVISAILHPPEERCNIVAEVTYKGQLDTSTAMQHQALSTPPASGYGYFNFAGEAVRYRIANQQVLNRYDARGVVEFSTISLAFTPL